MLRFLPDNRIYINRQLESVLESAQKAEVYIENACGANGVCGKCRVKILAGETNEITAEERTFFTEQELAEGWRLACKVRPANLLGTMDVELPDRMREKKMWEEETISHITEEEQRNRKEEKEREICKVYYNKLKEIGIWKTENAEEGFGVAVDIGTTNIEMLLWDLSNGECLARSVEENVQRSYGADVVSRIAYCQHNEEHYHRLCGLLQKQVGEMVESFGKPITKVCIVANAVMQHFVAGERIDGLMQAPYMNRMKERRSLEPEVLGLENCEIQLISNVESFVGADLLGVVAYIEDAYSFEKELQKVCVVDIGTNGELGFRKGDTWYVTSTAAGPAFEGASISCGMKAEYGAISGMQVKDGQVSISVIGDGVPRGLCGSGLIEVISCLLEQGVISETGYLCSKEEARDLCLSEGLAERLESTADGNQFVLWKDRNRTVALTQKDIRELQMAKAAIYTGVFCLMKACDTKWEDLECCYLAGAFGSHLNLQATMNIGLLPKTDEEKIKPIGNAALMGASMGLLQEACFEKMEQIKKNMKHISLSEQTDFQSIYFDAMNFPRN